MKHVYFYFQWKLAVTACKCRDISSYGNACQLYFATIEKSNAMTSWSLKMKDIVLWISGLSTNLNSSFDD